MVLGGWFYRSYDNSRYSMNAPWLLFKPASDEPARRR